MSEDLAARLARVVAVLADTARTLGRVATAAKVLARRQAATLAVMKGATRG